MAIREETYNEGERVFAWVELNRYINYLLGITIVTFILGAITYGEPFSFYDHAYSHLGRIRTQNGNPNTTAFIIFTISLLISAFICFRIEKILNGGSRHWLFTLCGTGYLVMLFPCDILNPVHAVGAALVIASLWFFTNIRLFHLIPHTGVLRFVVYQLILQGTVLPYAFMYVFDIPARHLAQKFALIGLIVVLKIAITESLRFQREHPFVDI